MIVGAIIGNSTRRLLLARNGSTFKIKPRYNTVSARKKTSLIFPGIECRSALSPDPPHNFYEINDKAKPLWQPGQSDVATKFRLFSRSGAIYRRGVEFSRRIWVFVWIERDLFRENWLGFNLFWKVPNMFKKTYLLVETIF